MKSSDLEILRQKSRPVQSSASHILDDSSSSSEDLRQLQSNKILRPSAIHSRIGYSHEPPNNNKSHLGSVRTVREDAMEWQSPRNTMNEQYYQSLVRTPSEKATVPASGITGSATGRRTCNCKHSKCLKLYCECFSSGEYCSNCNCSGCYNNIENEAARASAVRAILDRNPTAFRPKIVSSAPSQLSPAFQEADTPIAGKHNKVNTAIYLSHTNRAVHAKSLDVLRSIVNAFMLGSYAQITASAQAAKTLKADQSAKAS